MLDLLNKAPSSGVLPSLQMLTLEPLAFLAPWHYLLGGSELGSANRHEAWFFG
jgi:hypothetical protein